MTMIQKAMETVAKVLPVGTLDPRIGADGAVGKPMSRIDGPLKVAGAARFAAEVPLPNLALASLVYSTIARGRILRIDSRAAKRVAGVIAVLTHENCPKMAPPASFMLDPNGIAMSELAVMQDDQVRWNGQGVAVVIAETHEIADHAASLIHVDYERMEPTLEFERSLSKAQVAPKILGQPSEVKVGDADAAFTAAPIRIDQIYRTPREFNSAMEPHATTAQWNSDGTLTLYDSQQYLLPSRHTIAKAYGLPEEKVRIIAPFVGGAFGSKGVCDHHFHCIAAARLVGRPVRLVLSRKGVYWLTSGRTLTKQRVALGARPDGTLAALIHTGSIPVASPNSFMEPFSFVTRFMYASDTLTASQNFVPINIVPNGAMRAPGEAPGSFALECALDELAVATGIEPVELRRRLEPVKEPVSGRSFSSRNLNEAYRRGAERFGWKDRNLTPGSKRQGEWLIGHGVASASHSYVRLPCSARIRIKANGRVLVQTAAQEMGMGTATVQVQHAAERLGVSVDQVTFEYGDTNFPKCPLAGGSNQTASVVAAVRAASDVLIEELLKHVSEDSPLAGIKSDAVVARDGGLYRIDDSSRGETYISILKRTGKDHIQGQADAPPADELLKYAMHTYGAQFCEVRVSAVTGEIRVSRWVGSFDTGRIMNAKMAASQFKGAIVMGIGQALTEDAMFDERNGRFMNRSLAEYHVPVHFDVPEIEVIWNDIPDPHTPLGLKGVGEIGITGTAAAIANAIYNATGKRIRDLPITLDKILLA